MGIDDESSHPALCSEVADGVTRFLIYLGGVSLFREPDAGNLPVRFEEREQETGSSQTGLRRARESKPNSHREAKATAPVLDSTRDSAQNAGQAASSAKNLAKERIGFSLSSRKPRSSSSRSRPSCKSLPNTCVSRE
jgi:hypothetical protein